MVVAWQQSKQLLVSGKNRTFDLRNANLGSSAQSFPPALRALPCLGQFWQMSRNVSFILNVYATVSEISEMWDREYYRQIWNTCLLTLQFPLQCIPCSSNKKWHGFREVFGIDIARDVLKTPQISLDTSPLVPDILVNFEMSLTLLNPNTCTPAEIMLFFVCSTGISYAKPQSPA